MMTPAQIVTLLIGSLPKPEKISEIDFGPVQSLSVRFSYRNVTYQVDADLTVIRVTEGPDISGNDGIFLSALLKLKKSLQP